MPTFGTTAVRLVAVLLTITSVYATFYTGRIFIRLFFYYGTPGQSPQFYLLGCLVLLAIAAGLLTLWTATVYVLYRASSKPAVSKD